MNTCKISRQQLLEQACRLARESGLGQLNIRSVAATCGVSVGSVYNYFPTKAELVAAVVQDYWQQAFSHEELAHLSLEDFFASYRKMYGILYRSLSCFEESWLPQLALVDPDARQRGRQLEQDCFGRIRRMLEMMLQRDPRIAPELWQGAFSREAFVDFLFENTLTALRQGQESPDFLLELLHRLLLPPSPSQ